MCPSSLAPILIPSSKQILSSTFFFIHTLFCLKKLIQIFESYARLTFSFVQILSIFSTSKVLEEILPWRITEKICDTTDIDFYERGTSTCVSGNRPQLGVEFKTSFSHSIFGETDTGHFWQTVLFGFLPSGLYLKYIHKSPHLDSIAVSVFVVILVEFDKYWIWDEQACLPDHDDETEDCRQIVSVIKIWISFTFLFFSSSSKNCLKPKICLSSEAIIWQSTTRQK